MMGRFLANDDARSDWLDMVVYNKAEAHASQLRL
jgi:hypothetical protein